MRKELKNMDTRRYSDWYRKHNQTDQGAEPVIMWSPTDDAAEVYKVPEQWADLTDKQILLLAAERLGYTANEDNNEDSDEYIIYFDQAVHSLDIKGVDGTWFAAITLEIPKFLE